MEMIRPKVRDRLRSYAEPAGYVAAAALGAYLAWRGLVLGAFLTVAIGLLIAVVACMATLAWHRRTAFSAGAAAPGVVEIDEHRVIYWGPDEGGAVDLDLLTRLEIDTGSRPPVWILHHEAGRPLRVPLGARGADALPDTFASLPGVRLQMATEATQTDANARFLIWKRQGD